MSEPPFDPDDPRLTAYALGESDGTDRPAVETFLTASAEGREQVEQTRAIARVLTTAYAREHALYLASRADADFPANVVAFQSGRQRGWRRAIVPMLKAAAMVAIAASLLYLTLRGPHRSEVTTVASAPPGGPARGSTPTVASARGSTKDEADHSKAEDGSGFTLASTSDRVSSLEPASPPVVPAESSTGTALAMDSATFSGAIPAPASRARASGSITRTDVAAPGSALDYLKTAPGPVPAAVLAPLPSRPAAPEDQIAMSTVRVRTAAGAFFGGVVVSPDGLVLAVTALPESSLRPPWTVFLPDQRELPATAEPAKMDPGWYWLRVDAKGLTATAPAKDFPADGEPLTLASVDPRTGVAAFTASSSPETDSSRRSLKKPSDASSRVVENASFAFNATGEFLVVGQTIQAPMLTSTARAKSAPPSTAPVVRSLTAAERALLLQEIERNGQRR